jgi:hypothetical protein
MEPPDLTSNEVSLFKRAAWFNFTNGKDGPKLRLEGPDGPLATYTGTEAERIKAKLEWWRNTGRGSRAGSPANLVKPRSQAS